MNKRQSTRCRGAYTVPNALTGCRAVMGLTAGALFLSQGVEPAGVWLCALALALDAVDGWVARRSGQQSAMGALLDPAADKLVLGVVYATLAARAQSTAVWLLFSLMLLRDIAVSAARWRQYAATGLAFTADRLAKVKTALQSGLGLGGLFWTSYVDGSFSFESPVSVVLFAGVVALSWVSWVRYRRGGQRTVARDSRVAGRASSGQITLARQAR